MTHSKQITRVAKLLLATALVAGLAACFQDTNVPDSGVVTPKDNNPIQNDKGGTQAVTDASSPIFGAQIVVQPNSVPVSDNITFSYQDALPAPLDADVSTLGTVAQLSKVLILNRQATADFGQSADVTVPYDKSQLPADQTPIVVYWDESSQSYSPIAIKSIDRTAGTIVFTTAHASKYVVFWINFGGSPSSLDPSKLSVSLSFDPAVDSFFVHNFGSYNAPGGNSFGMAAYASWYYRAKKSFKGAGLRSLYKEGNPQLEEDDQTARELILRAYQAGNQKAHIQALDAAAAAMGTSSALNQQNAVALTLIQQLSVTKQPQLVALGKGAMGAWTDAKAVAVYAYDGNAKRFLYYDPNYPGEAVGIPWDPLNGFGTDSKNSTYNLVAFASMNSAYSSATLQSLYTAAEQGFPSSDYPKITISAPAPALNSPSTYEIPADGPVTIVGSVPRPSNAGDPTAQRYAHVYLNGSYAGYYSVDQSNNSFSIPLAKLPSTSGTDVMVLISETNVSYAGWGSGGAWAGGFHAFSQFRVRVANQYFFQNLGFETGDFTGWASELHTWGDPTQVVPSPDSAIITGSGFDPIATDLQVPLFGNSAARINNSANGYRISSLTQSAVVPTSANPVLRFYWSAVLEDPGHAPNQQPYIDIIVTNQTTSTELYHKRFYSNDPSYSGWLSYQGGQWKSIPWQLVELPMQQYIGNTITLKVEAADCALGGHGGYGYLDVDE